MTRGHIDTRAVEAAAEMFAYAAGLGARKRAHPGDDIATSLLQAEVDGERLTDMEFNFFFTLLINAGGDTTRNLVAVPGPESARTNRRGHPSQREPSTPTPAAGMFTLPRVLHLLHRARRRRPAHRYRSTQLTSYGIP